jgi:diguanylate cyclase (GGDEF)-like protein/PAS domain S-box-containing protein
LEHDLDKTFSALARLGIFFKDFKRDVHLPNAFWLDWGYTPEDMKGEQWLQALHPDDRDCVRARFERHSRSDDEVSQSVYRIVTKNGDTRWILSKSVIVERARDGRPGRMVGIDYDVTEMKEAEDEVARARQEAERRAREAETLRQAGAAIAATLDRAEAVARVLEYLRTVVRFQTATVQILREDELEVVDSAGPVQETCEPGRAVRVRAIPEYERVVTTGEPHRLTCPAGSIPDLPSRTDVEHASWIGVPLITRGSVLGLMTVAAEGGDRVEDQHLAMATALGDYVALAIQNAQLYEETLRAASTDPLTGAFSRYWFVPFAQREIARALREAAPLSLLVFDLDHFKRVNDEFGHQTGDAVLKRVSASIAAILRATDPLCRLGGEEFAVLVPGADEDIACRVAERIRRRASDTTYDGCAGLAVSISVGVASLGPQCSTYDALFVSADRALYRSKRDGRNRVTVAGRRG